jgi:glycosyltransferase involved in cell wall biosynthesis
MTGLPVLARRDDLDLFHGTVNVLPFGLRCRSVVTIHDLAFLRFPEQVTAKRYRYLKLMIGNSARRADAVIVPSVATGEDVAELLGARAERIAVVPLGVSDRFSPAIGAEIDRVRQRYDLTRPFVLAVGTIEPRKNLPRLIAGMAELRDQIEEDLVMAGPTGWLTDEVEQAITRSELGERIRRPGYIEEGDLVPLYSAASVVAMPSLYEGFGLPVLEAMATGAVVVTSNVSSLPEVAGGAAVLVDPMSVGSIAEGLRTSITDQELRARLRRDAIERARQFTWERTARETMAVYRSIAG